MAQDHVFVDHRDHVIVERAGVDRCCGLADEHTSLFIDLTQTRNRLRRRTSLSTGEAAVELRLACVAAIDKHMGARLGVGRANAGVVCRALVPEGLQGGQRIVHGETVRFAEDSAQGLRRLLGFDCSMFVRNQVGRDKMQPAVSRIH